MAQRRRVDVPTIDLTNAEPFALLDNEILKNIAKELGPTDLARLGIADKRLRDISSIQMAEIMADPRLIKLAQRYKSRLMRPHIHFTEHRDTDPTLFKFPLREVMKKGPDFVEDNGNYEFREEALLGEAYDYVSDLTRGKWTAIPFAPHDFDLDLFPKKEPLPTLRFLRDQIGRRVN